MWLTLYLLRVVLHCAQDKSRWYKSLAKVNFLERLVIHICR